jgi:hypothetical protein
MAKEKDETTGTVDPNMAALIAELRAARLEQPELQAKAFAKVQNPSNPVAPHISVFNPRGEKDHPLPRLKCEIHAPWKMHPEYHGLDREEVELFNLLTPGEYTVHGTDDDPIKIRVVGRLNDATGALERLDLHCTQFTADHKGQRLPAMRVILRELLGRKADGVMTMKDERAKIAAKELSVSVA